MANSSTSAHRGKARSTACSLRYALSTVVLLVAGVPMMDAGPAFFGRAAAAEKCGGKTFEVVRNGRIGRRTSFCVGGSTSAFAEGGRFYLYSKTSGRSWAFSGKRTGNRIIGSEIPNVPYNDGSGRTFTGKMEFTDGGYLVWHEVGVRRYTGWLR